VIYCCASHVTKRDSVRILPRVPRHHPRLQSMPTIRFRVPRRSKASRRRISVQLVFATIATTTTTATAGTDGAGQSGTASDTDNSQCLQAADVNVNKPLSYVTYYQDRASVRVYTKY